MKYIVWDWNGTLYNDVNVTISSMNALLKRHALPVINSVATYQDVFSFPVEKYYRTLGFDFETVPFQDLAAQFIAEYQALCTDCLLTDGIESVLSRIKNSGFSQVVVSASRSDLLLQQISKYHIEPYFDDILGIENIYAESKIHIARKWIKDISADQVIVIGDTFHDFEMAQALNASCILYSKGHQKITRSPNQNYHVVDNMQEVLEYIGV